MAGKSSKKQAHANVQVLKQLYTISGSVLGLLLLRLLFSSKKRWIWIILFHAPAAGCVYMLEKNGRPTYDSAGHVVREGMDLNQKGLTEWMFDIVYLTLFADSGVVVFNTMKFWYIMLLVPVYLGYKIKGIAGPMLGGMNNAKAPSASSTNSTSAAAKSKRQAKREKNADKTRFKYK
ncbi:LANO_0D10440g1_1 [Lachancea nothofagi CBS 11611]|uniref:LANO_0D10440g1_1 n=1 Tax=Lachancea nothofagi CBS 11611 TaxID=1266666 RepID=A0A1G4JKA3_9SACH|nr:LANO_0D10440g1_1 [Lachancea nothofagi CBS 11611]